MGIKLGPTRIKLGLTRINLGPTKIKQGPTTVTLGIRIKVKLCNILLDGYWAL